MPEEIQQPVIYRPSRSEEADVIGLEVPEQGWEPGLVFQFAHGMRINASDLGIDGIEIFAGWIHGIHAEGPRTVPHVPASARRGIGRVFTA